ncbi:LPXTG cell wall anchor domain-containing protein [Abiotrophia defectiva]|uniref:MSCRAMM family protein n=1 Tax=Abiotrophia defectiva TaxID=46125 RepID=UPI00227E420F|nr:SpaA isopeptide-forming pilin-related protein [Abiotrophia defectiva]MCY7225409.1 LPXTG cell wall anchor domain-containing protein [Abiotrophia defectiva]
MNRLRKIGAALAVAGMLATYVPSGLVLAQVNPNSPIEVSVDILLQVDANPPKRQENATYEIVDEAGNVVYRHESDAQASEAPKLTAGKYRLRLYDGQGFKRADKVLKAQKVETSIPKRSEQDIAANKQLQEQSDKGSLKTDDQGQAYYEVAFEVKAGPDLESADHQKMVSKLAVTLSDQEGAGSAPQAPAQSSSQAPEVKRNLTVKVLDQAQEIVPGATVIVEGQTAVTDENGDAHFKDLTPGTVHYAVTQLPAGYEGNPSGEAELPADTDHSITLQVAKKAESQVTKRDLTVKVLDQEQKTVAGVTVKVEDQSAVTDENGDAHFKGLTPGTVHYTVTQLPEGYEGTPSGEAQLPSDTDHSITLQVAKKAEPQVTKRDLTVKVLDQEQKTVAGVTVTVADQTAVTDENGDAHFKGLTPGKVHYAVTQLPEGYEGTPNGDAELPTDTDHSITLQVAKKAESSSQAPAAKRDLTVKVLDQEQKIVSGVTVTVEGQSAETDENGDAHFKGLTPGTVHYAVTDLPDGYEGTPSGDAELPSDTDHSITLQVTKKPAQPAVEAVKRDLTIKILDQDQKIVAGVTVTVGDQSAVTDENGDAHFKGLTPGKIHYAVTQLPEGYEGTPSGDAELPSDTDHSITLQVSRKDQASSSSSSSSSQAEKRDLTVKVLDNAGKEVPGVSVKIGDQVQVTNEYGQAVFKGLTPGTFHYEIVNLPENYTGAQAGDAELPTDTDHSITLTVQRQQAVANVTVKVMDDNNQSVPGVTVYLGELEGQTDDQGNILFEALEAGKYTYGIKEVPEAYQAATGAQTLDVAPGADLHPILKVSRKAQVASLELNVVNVAGQAVADVTLAVGNQQLKTDAQGKVTFTDLKAGDYDYYVVAVPEPYQLDQTKIKLTLANGQTAKRTIQLAEKPAASSSSSASSDKVTATKTSGVERKDGNLPSTGEQVMAWLTPLALALLALGGAILFFRRRKNQASTDASQDEDHEA